MLYVKYLSALIVSLLLALIPAAAQDSAPPVEISPALADHIDALESYTRNTRQLDQLAPIERLFPSRPDAIGYILGLYEAEFTPEQAERYTLFYLAFDLLPPDTDFLAIYLELLSAQVGGFYQPETRQMYTILLDGSPLGDTLPLMEQIIYVHEYTHALQDQHFDIIALQELAGDNVDHALAILALIEGDATLVMQTYTMSVSQRDPLGTGLRLLAQGLRTGTLTIPPGIPGVIQRELFLPYERGLDFVIALYREGEWEAVNAAFANPPRAMSQVLHPHKYLDGVEPVTVTLADPGLGDDWELLWDTTLGEFYLTEHLRTQLPAAAAAQAAAGWHGDRVHIYRSPENQLAWIMQIVWESQQDAGDFAAAYETLGQARFDGTLPVDGCWSGDDDALCMVTAGPHTVLITRAPTLDMAQALAASQ
jgi:hypothetical protein